jgi:hypothetical protein
MSGGSQPERRKVRVAYIAGAGFSGSTLLEQALSQVEGCVSVGEPFRPLFEPYWPMLTCGCGELFADCPFWPAVLDDAYGDRQEMIREHLRILGVGFVGHSVRSALAHSSPRYSLPAAFREIGSLVEPLYRSVAERTGSELIIDASKSGLWGLGVLAAPGIDLDVIHLVRDSRGFAFSNGHPHEFWPPGTQTIPRGPVRSFVNWWVTNLEAEFLARRAPRSRTVLYDTFARRPEQTLASIVDWLGVGGRGASPIQHGVLTVTRVAHTIAGNQRRPRLGATEIAFDERWKTQGSRSLHVLGPLLTGPLWHHYRRLADRAAPAVSSSA